MTNTTPNYRKPWEHGAHAYPEADNMAGIKASMHRRRKPYMLHVSNATKAIGNRPCATCGIPLGQVGKDALSVDRWSTWHIDPRTKSGYGQHYACSWMTLLTAISKIHL